MSRRRSPTRRRVALRAARWAVMGLASVLLGCSSRVSDTGFQGRWKRNTAAEPAQVSIWEDARGWHFCWSARWPDGGPVFTCTEDGRTVMSERGATTYAYVTHMTPEATAGEALVEVVGTPVLEGLTPITWTDRLVLDEGGLAISSWKLSLNGRTLDPPRGPIRLVKVADDPR